MTPGGDCTKSASPMTTTRRLQIGAIVDTCLLENLVFQIKRELEHKNGPGKPRVSDEQAIEALRKRYPDKWGVYPEKTLVAHFYDARRRLHENCIAYDHDAATTGNQD
jgi:hypothetical protein